MRDRLYNVPLRDVGARAMQVANALDANPAGAAEFVAAAAVVFRGVCEAHGLRPMDLYSAAGRMALDARDRQLPEISAVHRYIREEVKT